MSEISNRLTAMGKPTYFLSIRAFLTDQTPIATLSSSLSEVKMSKTLLSVAFTLLLVSSIQAEGLTFGAGASAGLNIPIAQDDQGNGSAFSIRGILRPMPMLGFEAALHIAQFGDPEMDLSGITNDLDGSDVTAYTADVILGGGPGKKIAPYLFAGIGLFDQSRDQTEMFDEEDSEFGWTGGLGLGIGLTPAFSIDIRGRVNIVPVEENSSRKSVFAVGGLNYYFGQ